MLRKFWPSFLFLAILLFYIAWINYQINIIYQAPDGASVESPVGELVEQQAIDLGETTIHGDQP